MEIRGRGRYNGGIVAPGAQIEDEKDGGFGYVDGAEGGPFPAQRGLRGGRDGCLAYIQAAGGRGSVRGVMLPGGGRPGRAALGGGSGGGCFLQPGAGGGGAAALGGAAGGPGAPGGRDLGDVGRSPTMPARATGPQVQGRAGPGRFPQEAKAACRRRESKPPFKRQERFFPAGGFLEVTSTAARMRLLLCAAAGAPGLSPCSFFPSRQAAGCFLNVGTFPFGSRSFPYIFLDYCLISSTASPAGPFFLYRQKEGKERPGLRPGPGRPKASVAVFRTL